MLFEEISFEDYREIGYEDGKLDDAMNMYKDGVSIQQIAKWTKLPLTVIEKAVNQNQKMQALTPVNA